jgi:hypothetical protein
VVLIAESQVALEVGLPLTKRCSKCGEVKGLDEFHLKSSHKDGRASRCKDCVSASRGYRRRVVEALPIGLKRCSSCGKIKAINEFAKDSSCPDKRKYTCRECGKESYRKYNAAHSESRKAYAKAYRSNRPRDTWATQTTSGHKCQHIREEILALAKRANHCPICGRELVFGANKRASERRNASLDRIDNGEIKTINDVWIICDRCNQTKSDRSMPEFVQYCKTVYEKFGGEVQ